MMSDARPSESTVSSCSTLPLPVSHDEVALTEPWVLLSSSKDEANSLSARLLFANNFVGVTSV